jgi:hypothetical protein
MHTPERAWRVGAKGEEKVGKELDKLVPAGGCCNDITVKQMPADVQVLTRRRLLGWLSSVPSTISAQEVDAIYAKARVAATWR